MPNGAQNLGMQLGQLIFGRPDDGRSYVQGQAAGALVDDRMASARRARAAAMIDEDRLAAREGVTPDALTTAGYAPNQSPLLGAILRSNTNVDLRNLGALQAPTAGQALTDAAAAVNLGDMARGNNLLALASGKPIQTTKVDSSGQVINPYGDPGQQVNLTALGDALVREKGASAADKSASAGAHAATARGFNPHTATAKTGKITSPDSPDAAAYLGNAANAEAFTAWRSQHPNLRDGNEAWIAFRSARPIGAPTGAPAQGDEPAPVYEAPASTIDLGALGQMMTSGSASASPTAPAKVGTSPYPEGTRLRGPGGKVYEVRGGVPVEVP